MALVEAYTLAWDIVVASSKVGTKGSTDNQITTQGIVVVVEA